MMNTKESLDDPRSASYWQWYDAIELEPHYSKYVHRHRFDNHPEHKDSNPSTMWQFEHNRKHTVAKMLEKMGGY